MNTNYIRARLFEQITHRDGRGIWYRLENDLMDQAWSQVSDEVEDLVWGDVRIPVDDVVVTRGLNQMWRHVKQQS